MVPQVQSGQTPLQGAMQEQWEKQIQAGLELYLGSLRQWVLCLEACESSHKAGYKGAQNSYGS